MRGNRSHGALLVGVVMLFATACGVDATTGSSGQGLAVTSTTPPSSTTAEPATADTAGLDEVLVDRSLLSIGLDATYPASGRFRLERGPRGDFLMTVTGRYWVTASGNVYTDLDVDADLIADEMELLTDHIVSTGGQPEDSGYMTSLRNHYQGSEFQIGLADLARWTGIGGPSLELIQQWLWLGEYQAEDPIPPEFFQCRSAIENLDSATRHWATGLEIELETRQGEASDWAFPMQAFEDALAAELVAATVCDGGFPSADSQATILITVTTEQETRRIEVYIDYKIYERGPELEFSVIMWPDNTAGDPPPNPVPAPLLTLRGTYLAAVGVCGQLPTIYNNFMAANTYIHPGSRRYLGPSLFESDWLCPDHESEESRSSE